VWTALDLQKLDSVFMDYFEIKINPDQHKFTDEQLIQFITKINDLVGEIDNFDKML